MPDSFYEPDGDGYLATELTRGPWDPGAQHAGPPAALIGREIERLGGGRLGGGEGPPAHVGRITYEILRSVPIARMTVRAEVLRPGRRVELVAATLAGDDGEPLMRAQGWRLRADHVEFEAPPQGEAPPGPEAGQTAEFFHTGYDVGYHSAMDYRFVWGAFMEPGPATVWLRMGAPLLPGERPTPLQRVLIAADTGNGISAVLDWRRYVFINVDLTVHLHRLPVGEWICLDSETFAQASGVGMTDSRLLDEGGPIGRAAQTLLVAEGRPPG